MVDDVCGTARLGLLAGPLDTASLSTASSSPADGAALSPMGFPPCSDDGETAGRASGTSLSRRPISAAVRVDDGIPQPVFVSGPGLVAMNPSPPVRSPLLEFYAPAFVEFSDRPNRRSLVDHFCNILSHLIVFREESGNPFQQLVLPLTRKSPPVMNAIYALASAHLECRGVENEEKSLYFHNRAIQGLAKLIKHDCKVDRNELLAAIMLLVYYEVVS